MSKSKMDKTLNDRIAKWVNEFSRGALEKDSYHIDELLEIDCPKNNWIDHAWRCYSQAVTECSKMGNIHVLLVFYLNTTHSARPYPKALNRQLFCTIDTPPEIFLMKNFEWDFFADNVFLKELGEQYSMSCYYLEDFDESDNTFWHYLYFTDGGE